MAIKPKYRELTSEELKELEKEFVDYLIVNGITADDWVQIKTEDPEKAEDIITLFSDVVLEGVLRKVSFLEFRSKSNIKTFQCLDQKMILMGLTADDSEVDFADPAFFKDIDHIPKNKLKVYTSEKKYSAVREEELFQMIQSGCVISDGHSFKAISLVMV